MNQYLFYYGENRIGNDFYRMSSIWKELENVNLVLINVCFDKDDLENYGYYIRVDVQFFMGKLIVIVVFNYIFIEI